MKLFITSILSNEIFSIDPLSVATSSVDSNNNQQDTDLNVVNKIIDLSFQLHTIAKIVDTNFPYDDKHEDLSNENVVATVHLLKACKNIDKLMKSVEQFASNDISECYKAMINDVEMICTFICCYLKVIAYYK